MRSTSIFPCIRKIISTFTIFSILYIFIFKFFPTNLTHFCIFIGFHLLIILFFFFLNLIISTACSLKDSQNVFMQSLPLYTPWLFSMLLNDDIVDIEKGSGICSPTFAVDEFPGIFLHPAICSFKHSRTA